MTPQRDNTVERDDAGDRELFDRGLATEVASLADNADLGIVRLSPAGEFETVSEGFAALTGADQATLQGQVVDSVFPAADVAALLATLLDRAEDGATADVTGVVPLSRADGDTVPVQLQFRALEPGRDDTEFVGVARRVPDGAHVAYSERESPLAQSFLSLAEAIPDGIIVLDTESDILYANPAVESILGHSPDELVGGSKLEIIPPRLRDAHLTALGRYLDTGTRNLDWTYVELPGQHADGHEVPLGISFNDFTVGGDRYFVGLFRDITARKEAEAEALRRAGQQETVAELGRHALEITSKQTLLDETAGRLAEMLDADIGTVFELDPDAETLRLCAASGLPDELADVALSATDPDIHPGYALDSEEPVVVSDTATTTRCHVPERLVECGVRSGICVVVGTVDDPWGVLCVHDTDPREFDEADVHAIESVANVLASAIDRHERTRQVETQRAQLDAIAQVYRVIQDVQQAVLTQSTREEIEQTVCDRLVELEPYTFAWIGGVEMTDRTVSPHAVAGDERGYLDEVRITAADEPHGQGPGGRALDTHDIQVVSDVATDETFEPWREPALARGYRSAAAVPIVYDGTVFGLLGLYATVPNAFGPTVRHAFDALGDILGHVIMAASQRQALHSDTITEIELQIEGIAARLGFDETGVETIRFDRMVPAGDGQFLMYGSTPAAPERIAALESLGAIESVAIVSETDEESRVEIRWHEAPISSVVSAFGGRIQGGVIDDTGVVVAVELPPTVEVKAVVEQVASSYPDTNVRLQQRTTRQNDSERVADGDVLGSLTERQRDALEAAFFAGYFEWPRESTANDIAEAMGISDPTFHQHLRGAQRRIIKSILQDCPPRHVSKQPQYGPCLAFRTDSGFRRVTEPSYLGAQYIPVAAVSTVR